MSLKIPKSGLADSMRDWMKARTGTKAQRRFTVAEICESLCVNTAKQHQAVAGALSDFVRRGEVEICASQKNNRRQYLYVQDWHSVLKGQLNRKVYKAMYVSQDFAVTDLQLLTGIQDRNWIDKLVRKLKAGGHLQTRYRRNRAGGGSENIYRVVNRDRFKLEVMR